MHCPSCGQKHVSSTEHLRPLPGWRDEVKFCSRCGFPMELVAELLDHGGFLPKLAELDQIKAIFTRKKGVVFSIFWMILLMMLVPAIIAIGNGPGEAQAISALIGLFGGLVIMIGSIALLPSSEQPALLSAHPMPPRLTAAYGLRGAQHQALPPQRSVPVSAHAPPQAGMWRDTNDLEPSNLSERTTRPLENEQRQ
jgi:hypothetical protein